MGSGYGISSYSECTCGSNSYGIWGQTEFINYCPLCGSEGGLGIYYMPCGDSEIHCYACGADYCAFDGWDKSGQFRAQLIVYVEPKKEPKKVIKKVPHKTKIQQYSELVKNNNPF